VEWLVRPLRLPPPPPRFRPFPGPFVVSTSLCAGGSSYMNAALSVADSRAPRGQDEPAVVLFHVLGMAEGAQHTQHFQPLKRRLGNPVFVKPQEPLGIGDEHITVPWSTWLRCFTI